MSDRERDAMNTLVAGLKDLSNEIRADELDARQSLRRLELAESYRERPLEELLQDINLLVGLAQFKCHMAIRKLKGQADEAVRAHGTDRREV